MRQQRVERGRTQTRRLWFFLGAGHSLLPRLDELVVLHGHLAAEGLARVRGGAVGVDDGHPSWQEEDT